MFSGLVILDEKKMREEWEGRSCSDD